MTKQDPVIKQNLICDTILISDIALISHSLHYAILSGTGPFLSGFTSTL